MSAGHAALAASAASVAIGAVVLIASSGEEAQVAPAEEDARSAAEAFLDRYLGDDGRVSRTDQGGDTVSEGQAYAMLLSAAIGDRERFDATWGWTRENLQRPDGLLASAWAEGEVADPESAADADLDAARALLLAGSRFSDPSLTEHGVALGAAVLEHETVELEGRPVLVAGPWAREAPATLNPSYFDPRSYAALGASSGDERWRALAESSRDLLAELVRDPAALPPDWARAESGTAVPMPSPSDPGAEARYGFDAVRIGIRMGASCSPADRELAADLWNLLSPPRELASEHALEGEPLSAEEAHPAALVGAAGAASAAGDEDASDALLARAADADADAPTYYGSAWVALGRVALETDWLGRC